MRSRSLWLTSAATVASSVEVVTDLEFEKRNIMLLCDRCHRSVHRNPFLQADMIKEKASELEIDYRSVYDNLHTEKGFKMAKFLFAKLVLKG